MRVGRSLVWRRGVIDDNDLLRQPVLVEFAPIRLLLPAALAGWYRAVGGLVGRHGGCGRRGRGSLGGLRVGEGGSGSGSVGRVCVRVG